MVEMKQSEKYLGLPSVWGRSKTEALNFISERREARTQAWKQSLLSKAGREV